MTWLRFAMLAGASDEREAELLLWEGTAFPFAKPRTIWYQLRHALRHKKCVGNPMARCCGKRAYK